MASDRHRLPVRLILRPGQNGTKKLLEKYGDRLVSVRYRYDEEQGKRYKTVELIEEEVSWEPELDGRAASTKVASPAPSDRFGVRIGFSESALREQVKQLGGIWRPEHKLWELSYAQIVALGLQKRIVGDGG